MRRRTQLFLGVFVVAAIAAPLLAYLHWVVQSADTTGDGWRSGGLMFNAVLILAAPLALLAIVIAVYSARELLLTYRRVNSARSYGRRKRAGQRTGQRTGERTGRRGAGARNIDRVETSRLRRLDDD